MSIPPSTTESQPAFPRVMDAEWEAMMARGEEPEIPDWVAEELDRRAQMIADGTVKSTPWEEVKARLEKKFGLA